MTPSARIAGPALALLAGLALTACRAEPEAPPPVGNVVFVLIDTLRADHVGAYGYERDTTPNLDALAAESLLFENVVAQSSWTHPSLISLFTARYPGQFHETYVSSADPRQVALSEQAHTLAEVLSGAGWETVSVSTNPYCHEPLEVMQGFETRHLSLKSPARWVVNTALSAVEERRARSEERPLFLYLHFMDVHTPLQPPPPHDTRYPTLDGRPHELAHRDYSMDPAVLHDPEARAVFRSHAVALYDGALRYVDEEIGRLLEELAARGFGDDTLVVVTSDHGEAHWDHVGWERELHMKPSERGLGSGHGHSLLRELVQVPWILRLPGGPTGRVAAQVRSLDIAPTLLARLGVQDPAFRAEGRDVLADLASGRLRDRPALSELTSDTGRQTALRDGRWQYLRAAGRELLFARSAEPLVDESGERPDVTRRLADEVDARVAGFVPLEGVPLAVPPDLKEQLRRLGYLQWEQSRPEAANDESEPAPER